MTDLIVGKIGYLISTNARQPLVARGNKYMSSEPLYVYEGPQKGDQHRDVPIIHHLFKSVRGGYPITVTNVDFRTGDVEFCEDGKPTKKTKHGQSLKVHPECTHRAVLSDPFLNVYNKGGWVI